MSKSISVIGAGSIGISTALHLQKSGWQVTLIDRKAPASETSFGNAGIINSGSMVALNSPAMHKSLATLLKNNKPQLRYSLSHIARNLPWALEFLKQSKTRAALKTTEALHSLTAVSLQEHKALMQRAGNMHRLSEKGWLRVYRHEPGFDDQSFEAEQLRQYNIPGQKLSADQVRDLEPSLKPIYTSGYLLSDANAKLDRSVFDVQAGFIMSPMEMGLRITTGVELNHRDAPHNLAQLNQVLPSIKQAIDLGEQTEMPIWRGNRPTLPDSRPIIGKAPKHDNVWMAFGHQHIGLMTGPITGKLLAAQINGEATEIDMQPFAPSRYVRSRRR